VLPDVVGASVDQLMNHLSIDEQFETELLIIDYNVIIQNHRNQWVITNHCKIDR